MVPAQEQTTPEQPCQVTTAISSIINIGSEFWLGASVKIRRRSIVNFCRILTKFCVTISAQTNAIQVEAGSATDAIPADSRNSRWHHRRHPDEFGICHGPAATAPHRTSVIKRQSFQFLP